jgi:hypothetical protein
MFEKFLCREARSGVTRLLLMATASTILASSGAAQALDPSDWQTKLIYHSETAYGPFALAGSVAYAGFLQEIDFPKEWGQGGIGYVHRLGSTLAYSGVRNIVGFGLDSALHQDPRYYRSTETGTWPRMKHAFRGTILTHTDKGTETFATWRFGSAYGAAFISNEWYPDRLNTVKLGLAEGSTQLGWDLLQNLSSEFWPDVKKKLFHRKP